jgi:hypothetical protein
MTGLVIGLEASIPALYVRQKRILPQDEICKCYPQALIKFLLRLATKHVGVFFHPQGVLRSKRLEKKWNIRKENHNSLLQHTTSR